MSELTTLPSEQYGSCESTPQADTPLFHPSPCPAPCEDKELASARLSETDVLVGTVRSDEQFDWCMNTCAYYVPAKALPRDALPVEVIALYEEGLNRKAGIKRYAEVLETRVVKRADIPVPMSRNNPDEPYYFFTVNEWRYLETPITLQGTSRGKPMLTNRFLLTHCRRSYQLVSLRTPEEYRLCELLCKLGEDTAAEPVFRRVGERHLITLSEGRLHLLDADGHYLYTCPASMLYGDPAEVLRRVAQGLGLKRPSGA